MAFLPLVVVIFYLQPLIYHVYSITKFFILNEKQQSVEQRPQLRMHMHFFIE